jgi:hypothetical protein
VAQTNGEQWLKRAEQYRVFAERAKDPKVRKGFLQLAQNCERIARQRERIRKLTDAAKRRGDK